MTTGELREKFLQYFKRNGHTVVPSDSLIPSGDPTLLFTSAGMVQFKKHFLGQTRLDFTRAASCQKCLRTSDIERVGLTARHLTFFEMLGNFSFGDYFKKEAIAWGWEFLTKEAGLDEKKLYPTIYKDDNEASELWKKFVPESRIVRLGEESNFWNMGPTGPCGPCSEILFDRGEEYSKGHDCPGPGCDCDRYMEVWNLVFTQFDRQTDGKLVPLPQKNIDTGMGLERLSMVVNGKTSSFETDQFENLIREIKSKIGQNASAKNVRIISDHIRSCTFLISDGILPSNEGRGYVLRRLLRRALREGWTLGTREPFLHKLAAIVARDMGQGYPELPERLSNIQSIIKTEEENTLSTIEVGTKTLETEVKKIKGIREIGGDIGQVKIPGEKVFQIYDTYGLGKEIQTEIVRDWGGELIFSEGEYASAKEKAVAAARSGWKGSGEKDLTLYATLQKKLGATVFKAYDSMELKTKILAVIQGGKETEELAQGSEGEILLAETPFYAESGGQVGDKGFIVGESSAANALVKDTQRPYEGVVTHHVFVTGGRIRRGDAVTAKVDEVLRRQTMRHHTATHLLHAALRKILGPQVTQGGSWVSPEKLRFDFTFPRALSEEELVSVEKEVNANILADIPQIRTEESLEEARKKGALAFFGDKYGAKVFVLNYGTASTEVCGGTHVLNTGDIGLFKIMSQRSVGSGVRRIEAASGEKANEFIAAREKSLKEEEERLREKSREKEKNSALSKQRGEADIAALLNASETLPSSNNGNVKVVAGEFEAESVDALRETADHVRDKLGNGIVILASRSEDKISFVVTLTPALKDAGFHAGKIAKAFASKIGGSGGGRDLFAQGGGKPVSNLKDILKDFPKELSSK